VETLFSNFNTPLTLRNETDPLAWADELYGLGKYPRVLEDRNDWEDYFREIIPPDLWVDDEWVLEFDQRIKVYLDIEFDPYFDLYKEFN
jgi:hypothetical protein